MFFRQRRTLLPTEKWEEGWAHFIASAAENSSYATGQRQQQLQQQQ